MIMEMFFTALYIGGTVPAYQNAKANKLGLAMCILNAFIWPSEIGWALAKKYTESIKE